MRLKELVRPYYLRWIYFRLFPSRYPAHFRDCWQFPEAVQETNPTQADGFLFLPMTDWHTRIQRTQHLARTIASRGRQCMIVNPHLGREFPQPYLFSRPSRLLQLAPNLTELHVHLPLEPVFHQRLLDSSETDRISHAIESLSRVPRLIQLVSFPVWSGVAKRLRDRFGFPIVYDCHDWLAGFRGIADELVQEERRLMMDSDLVLFSAAGLQDRHNAVRGLVLRNAVNSEWLNEPPPGKHAGVVIGYIGALDFWFDRAAVQIAAKRHPDWEFRLIGRIEDPAVEQLRSLPNVHLRGELAHEQLRKEIASFSVATIPFVRNELTLATNPIKLYEYFAYGLPVVSTRLPEVETFEGLTYLASTPEEFARQLEIAVAEDSSRLRQQRREVAAQETWDARFDQLMSAISPV